MEKKTSRQIKEYITKQGKEAARLARVSTALHAAGEEGVNKRYFSSATVTPDHKTGTVHGTYVLPQMPGCSEQTALHVTGDARNGDDKDFTICASIGPLENYAGHGRPLYGGKPQSVSYDSAEILRVLVAGLEAFSNGEKR